MTPWPPCSLVPSELFLIVGKDSSRGVQGVLWSCISLSLMVYSPTIVPTSLNTLGLSDLL